MSDDLEIENSHLKKTIEHLNILLDILRIDLANIYLEVDGYKINIEKKISTLLKFLESKGYSQADIYEFETELKLKKDE